MPNKIETNQGLVGAVCRQLIRCKHHPECAETFEIGLTFKGEVHHAAVCLFETVPGCSFGCGAGPMTRGAMRAHQEAFGACARRPVRCHQCELMVPLNEFEAHQNPDDSGICDGMVPCPFKCLGGANCKRQRTSKDQVLAAADVAAITMLRPMDVAAHQLECPCRPVECEVEGCKCPLMHHELADHKAKYKRTHEAIERALQPLKARVALLETEVAALHDKKLALQWSGVFRLPERATNESFKWNPNEQDTWKLEVNHEVNGIVSIGFEPQLGAKWRKGAGIRPECRHLAITVGFMPDIAEDDPLEVEYQPRRVGLVVRVLRAFDPARDTSLHDTADGGVYCLDEGTELERFAVELPNFTNVQSTTFDAFDLRQLQYIQATTPGAVQNGHFALAVELSL